MGNNFDPITGEPVKKKRKKIFLIVGIVAAFLLVLTTLVYMFEYSEWGKKRIVFNSLTNTFQVNTLMGVIDTSNIASDGMFTVEVDGEYEGVDFEMGFVTDLVEKQEYVEMAILDEYSGFSSQIWLNEDEIEIYIPEMAEKKFIYNYNDTHEGYIQVLAGDYGLDLEEVDDALRSLLPDMKEFEAENQMNAVEMSGEMFRIISEMEFDKVDSKECKINHEDYKCKGYKTIITEKDAMALVDMYEEFLPVQYSETSDFGDLIGLKGETLAEQLESLRELFEDMEDIELTFYVHKNQIAEVFMESDGTLTMQIFGGNQPLDNYRVEIEVEDESVVLEKEGETREDEVAAEYLIDDERIFEYTYEYDDMIFEIGIGNEETGEYYFEGEIDVIEDEINVMIDEIKIDSIEIDAEMEICISDECEIEKKPTQIDTFDVGRALQSDWEVLLYDLFVQTDANW